MGWKQWQSHYTTEVAICQKVDASNGNRLASHHSHRFDLPDLVGISMKLEIIVPFLIAIAAVLAIYREWTGLKATVRSQEERLAKLEESSRLRLPYKSYEEMLDLMAAVEIAEQDLKFKSNILDNIRGHAENAMKVGTKNGK